jgi:hypothetical protein
VGAKAGCLFFISLLVRLCHFTDSRGEFEVI